MAADALAGGGSGRGRPANKTSAAALVMWAVPVGFVRPADHRLEKMADRQVQQALAGVFKKFRALGSAWQTSRWDRDVQLPLPEVHPGTAGHDIIWQRPRGHRLHQMLTNPCEAGALSMGVPRSRRSSKMDVPGRVHGGQSHWSSGASRLAQHPGDISWDMFLQNHQLLEANRAMPAEAAGWSCQTRAGVAQWRCAVGAAAASSRFVHRGTTGRVPRDVRRGGRVDRGSSSRLTVGGLRVDPAVTAAGLEALQPAEVQAAFTALDRVETAHDTQRQAVE